MIMETLAILLYPQRAENEGLITPKTSIEHAFAQFPGYKAETCI